MPGAKKTENPVLAGYRKGKSWVKLAAPEAKPATAEDGEPKAPRSRPLDGTGKPYITLAQFLKLNTQAETGGHAKNLVREGGLTVNGTAEDRPGRKLHAGDKVGIAGQILVVELA